MRTLLIDTCGEISSLALAEASEIVGFVELPARASSQTLLPELARLLRGMDWTLETITAIGVVNGPGSFTGVRVGLACAKGLCEALDIPLIAVSRLEVLAVSAGAVQGFAALNAGRDELYVRNTRAHVERLAALNAFREEAAAGPIIVAEESLLQKLKGLPVTLQKIDARNALGPVLGHFHMGTDDRETADANYVRSEQQIYGPKPAQGASGS